MPRQEGQVRLMVNLWRNPDLNLGTEECEDKLVMSASIRAYREECQDRLVMSALGVGLGEDAINTRKDVLVKWQKGRTTF